MAQSKKRSERRQIERVAPPGDHHVLLMLPAGDERLEPILDLSPHGVAVLVRTQRTDLQPGVFIPRARFFTGGECTLQCQATVRDVAQVNLETGGLGLKVGLELALLDSPEPSQPLFDRYSEPQIILNTLENLAKAKAELRLVVEGQKGEAPAGTLVQVRGEGEDFALRLEPGAKIGRVANVACELRGECYGTRLAVATVVTSRAGDLVHLKWPRHVAVWRNRVGGRVRALPSNVEIEFESPFTRVRRRRKLVDVSARGAAFLGQPDDGVLVGMLLPSMEVHLAGSTAKTKGVVRNVRAHSSGELLVGVEFTALSEASARVLASFVDTNLHPSVRPAEPADLPRMWTLFEDVGLFERHHAALSPTIGRIETVRNTLLTRARDLCIHLVGGTEEVLEANAELLHTYSRTWTIQHVGVHRDSAMSADQLLVPLVEGALRRKDFQYLHALLDTTRSQAALTRLQQEKPDPENLAWREWTLMSSPEQTLAPFPTAGELQDAAAGDLTWIAERLGAALGPLERSALDLSAAELELVRVSRLYHNVGLERRRQVRMAFSVGGPLGFSLIELTTPGVTFTSQGDVVRLFPARADATGRREALATLAHDAIQRQRQAGRTRTSFLVTPADAPVLEQLGLVAWGPRVEVIASRSGAAQIINFINLLA